MSNVAASVPLESAAKGEAGRWAHIDALRAIAALLVVWIHVTEKFVTLSPVTQQGHWVLDSARAVDVGRIGVALFFVISGFVIPFSIRAASPAPVREFLVRRFFRIFPLYWFSIPLGILTGSLIWGTSFRFDHFLVNLTLLQYWLHVPTAMGLYWTLVVEVLFYLACAALLYMRGIFRFPLVATVAIALIALHVVGILSVARGYPGQVYLTSLWFLHLGLMFWGLLFRAWHDGRLQGAFVNACLWGMLLFLLLIYPFLCRKIAGFPYNYFLPYVLAICIFVVGTLWMKVTIPPAVWIGRISYSIYLMHPVVFLLMLRVLMMMRPDSWWRTQHLITYLVINIVLTIALSALTYRWIEQPAIAMGRRLARRWFDTPRMAADQAI